MDNLLERTLYLMGLGKLEVKIFSASFTLGLATIPEIARASKIKRSTAYLIVAGLIDKGYLLEEHGKYANKIKSITPQELLTKLAAKERRLKRLGIEFQDNINLIQSIYQSSEIRPKVVTFKGNDGLLSIWKDILTTKNEILLWTNQQTENQFFGNDNHNKFIKERLSRKIRIRVLATNTPEALELQKTDDKSLRITKILPPTKNLSAETYIYDNKVAILDYNKDIIGIIIESKSISESNKAIFETVWNLIN